MKNGTVHYVIIKNKFNWLQVIGRVNSKHPKNRNIGELTHDMKNELKHDKLNDDVGPKPRPTWHGIKIR